MRTSEQQDFIDVVTKGNKNITLRARAGTGKTHTIVECGKEDLKTKFQVNVFNKKNEVEMNQRFPDNMFGSTWHSFGMRSIKVVNRGVEVDKDKVRKLLERKLGNEYKIDYKSDSKEVIEIKRQKISKILELTGLLKSTYTDPSPRDVNELMAHHGITMFTAEGEEQLVNDSLFILKESDEIEHVIDYDDMIRFPVLWGRVFSEFDKFIGDESQDNNRMRTLMAKLLYEKGIPCHFVGDDRQSIYGFTGADTESLDFITSVFNSAVMPLTVNFRCGHNIIREAQRYVKDIRAYEGNCQGTVMNINEVDFLSHFKQGDCALSRTNAAMIPFCFKLLKEGKHASIQGADFGNKIIKIVEGFSQKDINDLYDKLEIWYERQRTKLDQTSSAFDSATDTYEVVRFFADQAKTLHELKQRIKQIFSDEVTPYKFSTAHKAKGLEWDNVFILNNDNFKMTYNKKPWQVKQEENLHYVAITRARELLVYVASKDKKPITSVADKEPNVEKPKNKFEPMHQTEMLVEETKRDELDDFLDL